MCPWRRRTSLSPILGFWLFEQRSGQGRNEVSLTAIFEISLSFETFKYSSTGNFQTH